MNDIAPIVSESESVTTVSESVSNKPIKPFLTQKQMNFLKELNRVWDVWNERLYLDDIIDKQPIAPNTSEVLIIETKEDIWGIISPTWEMQNHNLAQLNSDFQEQIMDELLGCFNPNEMDCISNYWEIFDGWIEGVSIIEFMDSNILTPKNLLKFLDRIIDAYTQAPIQWDRHAYISWFVQIEDIQDLLNWAKQRRIPINLTRLWSIEIKNNFIQSLYNTLELELYLDREYSLKKKFKDLKAIWIIFNQEEIDTLIVSLYHSYKKYYGLESEFISFFNWYKPRLKELLKKSK